MISTTDSTVPLHPHGEPWAHIMQTPDGRTHYADTVTELLSVILSPDYADPDTDEPTAVIDRYEAAVSIAAVVQTGLNQAAFVSGDLHTDMGEAVLTSLHADKDQPWTGLPEAGFGEELRWDEKVPLVLIATDYSPCADLPKPVGNIVWIDPASETAFLGSLHVLGLVQWSAYTGEDLDC